MKAKDLIEELQKLDPELECQHMSRYSGGLTDIDYVQVIEKSEVSKILLEDDEQDDFYGSGLIIALRD